MIPSRKSKEFHDTARRERPPGPETIIRTKANWYPPWLRRARIETVNSDNLVCYLQKYDFSEEEWSDTEHQITVYPWEPLLDCQSCSSPDDFDFDEIIPPLAVDDPVPVFKLQNRKWYLARTCIRVGATCDRSIAWNDDECRAMAVFK